MNTSYRLFAALLSSMTLFACAGGAPSTHRGAVDPSDDAAWHPGEKTELSFGGASVKSPAADAVGQEGVRPAALRPNRHEVPRGRLFSAR